MNGIVENRSGDVIAAEINGIKRQVEKTVRGIMLSGAMEIGRLLIEAKAVVPHGEWGRWLETNVDYSQTTANDMMRLYTEYRDGQISLDGGPSNEELFGALAPSKALALLALPREERREFVQKHDVEDMSYRKLKDELAQVKADKEAVEASEAAARAELAAAVAQADKAKEAVETAEEKRKEAEEKRAAAEMQKEKAVKEAVASEREKLEKKLKTVRENLEKALERETEKEQQIDMLKAQLDERPADELEESPEVTALRSEVERLEKQLRAADPAFAKFGVLLEQYQGMFYDLIETANGSETPESRAKMREILIRVQAGFTAELTEGLENV